jgi:hypothetical protein
MVQAVVGGAVDMGLGSASGSASFQMSRVSDWLRVESCLQQPRVLAHDPNFMGCCVGEVAVCRGAKWVEVVPCGSGSSVTMDSGLVLLLATPRCCQCCSAAPLELPPEHCNSLQ